jgi:acetylornithine deacetylase/succinyl-diaminopimelate desuccinylase-like protein
VRLRGPAAAVLALLLPTPSLADDGARRAALAAREYREAHGEAILGELAELLRIPNVAVNRDDIERNAARLVEMLKARGAEARILRGTPGPPAVYGEIRTPGAERTVVFYAHYDGQPVDPGRWTTPPWEPTLRSGDLTAGAPVLDPDRPPGPLQDEWRLYARSASDDKAPIVAALAAIDALRAAEIPLSVDLKLFLEGEEEAGSEHLTEMLREHAELLAADLWLFGDGPVHQSGRPQVVYGARGVMGLQVTAYGPLRTLHSGHYGNWAPNPIAELAELLAGMRDSDGKILIDGFYDDVRPPSPLVGRALERYPAPDAGLREELALGRTEGGGRPLLETLLQPALNLRGISSGAVGPASRNAIPTEATASIDFRLVPGQTPERVRERVEAHLAQRGYHVTGDVPDAEARRAHPRLVRLEWESGYAALGTPMDHPLSRAVPAILDAALQEEVLRVPLLGGSLPLSRFHDVLGAPLVLVPIVNHDNNQHAPDENLRLGNLWRGIECYAALFARLGAAEAFAE